MITCGSIITCDEVVDGAAKFYNDASETAPINFNVKKSRHKKWIIVIVIVVVIVIIIIIIIIIITIFYTLFY